GGAGAVHEHQSVPFGHGQRDQAPFAGRETGLVLEAGGRPQLAGQRVSPRVIRADDHLLPGGGAALEQFMPPVPAAVRERVQHAFLAACQQHAAGTGRLGAQVPGFWELVTPAHAHPAAAEEVPLLPPENLRVYVGGARQHPALPERQKGGGQSAGIERRGRVRGLTDHTVKAKRDRVPVSSAAASAQPSTASPPALARANPAQARAPARRKRERQSGPSASANPAPSASTSPAQADANPAQARAPIPRPARAPAPQPGASPPPTAQRERERQRQRL